MLGNIPWAYGQNRVTPMPVDPVWLFVYWELTDEAIEDARRALGAPHAGCVLRIYDTTYQLFDGTNANWRMDVEIYRPANNHYVRVERPGATLHVDLGVAAGDRFHPIVRSAPIEMPRNSIAEESGAEWMTVTPAGAAPPPYAHRFTPRRGWPAGGHPGDGVDTDRIMRSLAGEGWARAEWSDARRGGWAVRWVGPFTAEWWRLLEPGAFTRVEIVLEGVRRVIQVEHGERVVFGPWQVTIRGLDPLGGHRVVDRWEIHYSWLTEGGTLRVETGPIVRRILEGYRSRLLASGSEERLVGEAGASEALQLGASEWRWLGGSEMRLAGASETLFLAASEWLALGASEIVAMGASEILSMGASEWQLLAASERMGGSERWLELMGASEGLLGGASERMRGSEPRPGEARDAGEEPGAPPSGEGEGRR